MGLDAATGDRGPAGAARPGRGSPSSPSRVFGQDILGLVMLLDMAAMRDGVEQAGGDPTTVSPKVAVDVIIDHSLQVDSWANPDAARINLAREYERNGERFAFLRWCATAFDGVRVVPPGKGIMHQLHIEKHRQRGLDTHQTPEGELADARFAASAPTATRRWSTGWACSAGAWAGSRPRR